MALKHSIAGDVGVGRAPGDKLGRSQANNLSVVVGLRCLERKVLRF